MNRYLPTTMYKMCSLIRKNFPSDYLKIMEMLGDKYDVISSSIQLLEGDHFARERESNKYVATEWMIQDSILMGSLGKLITKKHVKLDLISAKSLSQKI
jgi:TRAP-type mannitol/chloroaromatic compound transport system permease small subunit